MEFPKALRGALAGLLVGEAFGLPYDQTPAAELPEGLEWRGGGVHGRPPGTYGEAGGLSLATADSLLSCGRMDVEHLARAWVRWWAEGVLAADGSAFDTTATTALALQAVAEGVDPERVAVGGEQARGPGPLLRTLPAAFLPEGVRDGDAVAHAMALAGLTQRHPEVGVAVAAYVLLLRRLGEGAAPHAALENTLLRLPPLLREREGAEWEAAAEHLASATELSKPGDSAYVLDLLGSAWLGFADADGYEAALVAAVRRGGYTAFRAALAGGLAGARWGLSAVPENWRRDLRLDTHAAELLLRLGLASARRS